MCAATLNRRTYDRARSYLPATYAKIYEERFREQTNVLLQIGSWKFTKTWHKIEAEANDTRQRTVWVQRVKFKSMRKRASGGDLRTAKKQAVENNGGIVSWKILCGMQN